MTDNFMNTIITQDLIDKVDNFFTKYKIDKNCDDIRDNIVIISETQCLGKYKDMKGMAGKYDPKTRKLILVKSKITERVFVHEYMHKKSAKRRFLRKDLLGVRYNRHFTFLDEAITERITCEILNIPQNQQQYNEYYSIFIGLEKLFPLISWEAIVLSYFGKNKKLYKKKLGKDLNKYLDNLAILFLSNPIKHPSRQLAYTCICNDIQNIIERHL